MKYLSVLAIAVLLFGCSGTYQRYQDTLELALAKPKDAFVSLQHVKASNTDLMSVKNGDNPKAIVALAFLEDEQDKWISGDQVLFTFQFGRLIRTLGLPSNLMYLSNLANDPLQKGAFIEPGIRWTTKFDLDSGLYAHSKQTRFGNVYSSKLTLWGQDLAVKCVEESVTLSGGEKSSEFKDAYQNTYCFEVQSGILVKSIQSIPYVNKPLEFTYLSRIARLL
jgi:hypothetical protein